MISQSHQAQAEEEGYSVCKVAERIGARVLQPYPQDYCPYCRRVVFISPEVRTVLGCGILALLGTAISSLSAPESKQLFVSKPVRERYPVLPEAPQVPPGGRVTWKLLESK